MTSPEVELAARATSLLLQVAGDGADSAAGRAYDDLLYRFVFLTVKTRAHLLGRQAAYLTKSELQLPRVAPADVDSVAHDVTVAALHKARASALRFDPTRGDGATWALNAAALAFVDVVRAWYGVRRVATTVPLEPDALARVSDASRQSADPADVVETRTAIDAVLAELSDDERYVILAHLHHGLSYSEIALYRFSDETATKRVDRLMQSARRKIASAEAAWRGGTDAA
jgi:DNA-directed RNA polymerase specialized sigma24 family protein